MDTEEFSSMVERYDWDEFGKPFARL